MANLITSVNTKTSTNTTVHFLPRCAVVTRVFCPVGRNIKYRCTSVFINLLIADVMPKEGILFSQF